MRRVFELGQLVGTISNRGMPVKPVWVGEISLRASISWFAIIRSIALNAVFKMRYPIVLVLCWSMIFLLSCTSSRKVASASKLITDTLPALPNSEIDLPVKIYAVPILAKAEAVVPKEFTSDTWPSYLQPSCDFRYKYRFTRSPLSVSCLHNRIAIQFDGSYQIAGSRCICSAGQPITPWISGSCGFGNETPRRVTVALNSVLNFLPTYQIRTVTSLRQIQAPDKCQVSLFSSDITQMVVDSIRSSVVSFCAALDTTLAELSFSGLQQLAREKSYRKTNLGAYGYLAINPVGVWIGQLDYLQDTFSISLGLTCRPSLTSDSANHLGAGLPPLPALVQKQNSSGISLYLNAVYDYGFLSKTLDDSLRNKVFEVKGRTVVVRSAQIKSIGNHQIEIRIDFSGTDKGSIYVRGTPVLDSAKQSLSFPDLSYSLQGEDLALKVAKSLFHNKIKKSLEGKSFLDVAALVKSSLPAINQQLNRKLTENLFTSGKVNEVRLLALLAGSDALRVQVYLNSSLSILSSGQF
jgi:hypothetical protein